MLSLSECVVDCLNHVGGIVRSYSNYCIVVNFPVFENLNESSRDICWDCWSSFIPRLTSSSLMFAEKLRALKESVQISVVIETLRILERALLTLELSSSYFSSIRVVIVFRQGTLYKGAKVFSSYWNPLSSMNEKGWWSAASTPPSKTSSESFQKLMINEKYIHLRWCETTRSDYLVQQMNRRGEIWDRNITSVFVAPINVSHHLVRFDFVESLINRQLE